MFLYTKHELSEKQIENIIPFTTASKRIKYQGINLTKEVKSPYTENYSTSMLEIEEDTNQGKDILCNMLIFLFKIFFKRKGMPCYKRLQSDTSSKYEKVTTIYFIQIVFLLLETF